MGDTTGEIVAGGNGEGDRFDQLHHPTYIFVDKEHSIYFSDQSNHCVVKWMKSAKEDIVVAGAQESKRREKRLVKNLVATASQDSSFSQKVLP
jgi:hypothetical protein